MGSHGARSLGLTYMHERNRLVLAVVAGRLSKAAQRLQEAQLLCMSARLAPKMQAAICTETHVSTVVSAGACKHRNMH